MSHRVDELNWPGGAHDFALPLSRLRALQESLRAGPAEILRRLADGTWRVDDPVEVLRQGLIGAGMPQSEAGPLVARLAETHGLLDFVMPARLVLTAALVTPDGEPAAPGELPGVAPPPSGGASPSSTASAP